LYNYGLIYKNNNPIGNKQCKHSIIAWILIIELNFGKLYAEQDELLWAAAWLYQASNNQYYLDYLGRNGDSMGGTGWQMTEFSWDVKYPGVQTLVAKVTSIY
jgi:hypothetical protein